MRAAVAEAAARLVGAYGLAVMADAEPGTIIACRKDSPIVVGCGETGSYVASDIIAMIDATRDVVVLADGQMARLRPDGIEYYDEAGNPIKPDVTHVDWDLDVAEKGGYPDFMLKEIHEQPRVIRDTLAGRLVAGSLVIDELDMTPAELNLVDRVYIIACGTSYHAGLIAKNLIESWARIPCEVEVASEFRYRNPIITPTTLVVAVSQSGETADTLAAIRDARVKGAKVFGITNVVGSPVARESDGVIYTKANKEIAVASTKSFLGQVVSLTLLAMLLGQAVGRLTGRQIKLLFSELADTAEQVERILADCDPAVEAAADAMVDATSALFIGRGMGAATSYEGALKMKEISYIHSEAYAAGELKHGTISLIEDGTLVVGVLTQQALFEKTVSNMVEVKSRGAYLMGLTSYGNYGVEDTADFSVYVPKTEQCYMTSLAIVPLQLMGYYVSVAKGLDVDKPRNLAKSVTVE